MAGILKPDSNVLSSKTEAKYIMHGYQLYDQAENLFNQSLNDVYSGTLKGSTVRKDKNFTQWYNKNDYLDIEFKSDVIIWDLGTNQGDLYIKELNIYDNTDGIEGQKIGVLTSYSSVYPTWQKVAELKAGRYLIKNDNGNARISSEWYLESTTQNKTLVLSNGEYKKWNEKKEAQDEVLTGNLIPIMTSNTKPIGVAFASSADSSNGAWSAFDSNKLTYHQNMNWVYPYNLGYIFNNNEKKKVKAFGLTPSQVINMYSRFKIQGSNDTTNGQDGTWVDIEEYDSVSWNNNDTEKIFVLDKIVDYYSYRIHVLSATRAFYTTVQFSLYGVEQEKLPAIPSSWSTVSSTLPTKIQFETEGMDNLSPLLNRVITVLDPVEMADKSDILNVDDTGKIFSKTLDLKKDFDIRSIEVEVK